MTRDEILNMPAGNQMDILIGKRVMDLGIMDWINYPDRRGKIITPVEMDLPHYSTDIAAAWEVANRFGSWRMKKDMDGYWFAVWHIEKPLWTQNTPDGESISDAAPLAICRAALLAMIE